MKILQKLSHDVAAVGEKDYLLVLLHSLRFQWTNPKHLDEGVSPASSRRNAHATRLPRAEWSVGCRIRSAPQAVPPRHQLLSEEGQHFIAFEGHVSLHGFRKQLAGGIQLRSLVPVEVHDAKVGAFGVLDFRGDFPAPRSRVELRGAEEDGFRPILPEAARRFPRDGLPAFPVRARLEAEQRPLRARFPGEDQVVAAIWLDGEPRHRPGCFLDQPQQRVGIEKKALRLAEKLVPIAVVVVGEGSPHGLGGGRSAGSGSGPRGKDTGCGSTGVISVGQAIDQALAEKSRSKRPTYLADLAKRWRRFERWLPADKRKAINSLTKVDIRRVLNDCELRPVGERNMLRNLSVLFTWAVYQHHMAETRVLAWLSVNRQRGGLP